MSEKKLAEETQAKGRGPPNIKATFPCCSNCLRSVRLLSAGSRMLRTSGILAGRQRARIRIKIHKAPPTHPVARIPMACTHPRTPALAEA